MDVARQCREEAGADIGGLVDHALDYIGRPGDLDIEMQRRMAPRELHDQRRQEGEPDALDGPRLQAPENVELGHRHFER